MKKSLNFIGLFIVLFLFPIVVNAISIKADGNEYTLTDTTINPVESGNGGYSEAECRFSDESNSVNASLSVVKFGSKYKCQISTNTPGNYIIQYGVISDDASFVQQGQTSVTAFASNNDNKISDIKKEKKEIDTDFNICDSTKNPTIMAGFKLGGIILMIIKIVVPILLIVWGMFDMSKAVVSDKQDAIKKSAITFGKRAIAGVLIFFVPTILLVAFSAVEEWTSIKGKYDACINCLLDVSSCKDASFITK